MPKVLSIVESAYRATLEEQDDTILWINHACKNNGADITLLLRGNSVNYAVKGQNAAGLKFGELQQPNPPQIDRDLGKIMAKGVKVYLVAEDLQDRGLSDADLIAGIEKVPRRDIPGLLDQYDQVWHW